MNPFRNGNLPAVYLKPGQVKATQRPNLVTTVLGSCVAVVMFHPGKRAGAICHSMLPRYRGQFGSLMSNERFKYVDYSIRWMVNKFARWRMDKHELQVKLFGGSDMLPTRHPDRLPSSVGKENVEMALIVMEAEGLSLTNANVGGKMGRKICFHTHTGEVYLKRVRNIDRRRI